MTDVREPVQILEIEQPACALTYGSSPCAAAVGVTGERKCFNTHKTCQDPANYDGSSVIKWRLMKPLARPPRDLVEVSGNNISTNPIPSLKSVSTSPSKLNVGGGGRNESPLGRRASVTAILEDHPWDDSVGDYYVDERDYKPFERGTFWSKWIARNPYYNGYICNVYDGYLGESLGDMSRRTYILDRIDGPDANGRVRLVAKDPLKLADDKRAQFPPPTDLELRDAIDDTQTTGIVVLGAEADLLAWMGNAFRRYVRFGDEIIAYNDYTGSDGEWTLTGVTRAELGTEPDEHDAGDNGQRVGRYETAAVWDVARDMLELYSGVPFGYVPVWDWEDEGTTYLGAFNITGTVAEPTPVLQILSELTEQCLFYIWWDERTQTIPLKAIRAESDQPPSLNEREHILRDTLTLKTDPEQRISRVIVYYQQRNPTEALDDVGNYARVRIRVDGTAESDDQYGESRTRRIFSRWLVSQAQAIQVSVRLLARYRDNPRYMTLRLDAKDRSIWTADVVDVTTRMVVDETGESKSALWQVISAEEVQPGEVVQYDLQRFEFVGRFGQWMALSAPTYASATESQRESGAWWADEDGLLDGDEGYQFQ